MKIITLHSIITVLLCIQIPFVDLQTFECPSDWFRDSGSCYRFAGDIPKTYEEARRSCSEHGAGLVSVGSKQEHEFVVKWLQVYDKDLREWYTSGIREFSYKGTLQYVWQGTGDIVEGDDQFWVAGQNLTDSTGVIVYMSTDGGYMWSLADPSETRPYICEVPEAESYRIYKEFRDFDYGLRHMEVDKLGRGPHFISQPHSTVIVGKPPTIQIECVASGNPQPTYTWYKGENYEQLLTQQTDSRYSFTNGKLTITKPEEKKDLGRYRCVAMNDYGSIISDGMQISFGDLGEFSNVPDAPVNARAYEGAAIDCSRIAFRPAVRYQWFKKGAEQVVRPQYQKYMFISQSGKLYFSEVTRADEGKYYCIAVLTGVNQYTIGTNQPPTRTSLPIMLHVHDKAPIAEWGPVIQNEFIGVFPKPPMVGQDISLECFAYGTFISEFQYSWRRENKPLPKKSYMEDNNRVLVIRDATLDDQGVYTCLVKRGPTSGDQKSFDLKLGAKPYFITPLRDQHADVGSQFTWRCDARASPVAYFQWYKNGELLSSDPSKYILVRNNVLVISHLDPDLHNGMYQCAASNDYGTTLSEGQLRVLSIPPNFYKYPMAPYTRTSIMGNLTLYCRPEGAPLPVITWYKNGVELQANSGNVARTSRGFLVVTNVNTVDEGKYTCRATNTFGEAEDSTIITVTEGTSITVAPQDQTANVNTTVFLFCHASYAKKADMIYNWLFNGARIDFLRNPEYRAVQDDDQGKTGLYIIGAGFRNAGFYQCVATTTVNSDMKGAYVTVVGPPFEPAGVMADTTTVTTSSVVVKWMDNADNGRPITHYIIEAETEYEKNQWQVVLGDIAAVDTVSEAQRKRYALVTDLNPGCGYRFRVTAVNHFGRSPPSIPSVYIQTVSAPPIVAPSCVGGGDGSVGDLTMNWLSLTRAQQAGPGIGYRLYWRRHRGVKDDQWSTKEIKGDIDHYVTQVGVLNYYLEYDFMVQAFNDEGDGPNSTEVIIMSAEDLPIAVPTNVSANVYNGTAIEVTWIPVPQVREIARGEILGYQINYWREDEEMTEWRDHIRYWGQVDTGLIIGLSSDNFHYMTVQAYNSAGLGPVSEWYFQETLHAPISTYPEEIRVYSAGHHHVEVWWRGIHILPHEGNLYGFVVFYWPANEHYRSACQLVLHDHHAHHAHIEIDPGVVYAVRVAAFGEGGYGKKSLTTYFTLEGNNILVDYNLAQTVDSFRTSAPSSSFSGTVLILSSLLGFFVKNVAWF